MHDPSFHTICGAHRLSTEQQQHLCNAGFLVLPNMLGDGELVALERAYDTAMAAGEGDDFRVATSTTRLNHLVSRGPAFESLFLHAPLLAAASLVIGGPFKLSSLLARTLRPHTPAQDLHVDLKRNSDAFPMLGFILMIDSFRPDNGGTRFIPGSHLRPDSPETSLPDLRASLEAEVLACGPAGAATIFNASTWHGHTANLSDLPRRSIQGYFVPRDAHSGSNPGTRLPPETLARLSPLAQYLLVI